MDDAFRPDRDSAATIAELLRYHPVIGALPDEAVRCLQREGRSLVLTMGAVLEDAPRVCFVVTGAVGVFLGPGSSCVGFVGPGGLHGLDRCFAPATREHLVALLDTRILEVEAERFAIATGTVWTERMFGHQATGRLRSLAAEAACCARHTVAHRTARWLLKLEAASASRQPVNITQFRLAEVLGVQRTTVNAALRGLQHRGVISMTRGAITIIARDALRDAACRCDGAPAWVRAAQDNTPLLSAAASFGAAGPVAC